MAMRCGVCGFRWEGEEEMEPIETCPKCGAPLEKEEGYQH
ncbi:rubredoxin-like domain-containing protein [Ferroglobus placidus]